MMWRNPWEKSNVEVPANGYDYIIYQEDGVIYAKNGKTGEVELSGSDWGFIINSIINNAGSNTTIFTKNVGTEYTFTTPVVFDADNVKLLSDGATIKWGVQDTSTIPIEIKGNDLEVAGFDFQGMWWTAIWANYSGSSTYEWISVHNNKFSGANSVGTYLAITGYDHIRVFNNYFDPNDDAIQVVPAQGNDNYDVKIYSNYIKGSNIEIGGWGVLTTEYLRKVSVYNNIIVHSSDFGKGYILLSGSGDGVKIYHNTIEGALNMGITITASIGNTSVMDVDICCNKLINSIIAIYPSTTSANITDIFVHNNKAELTGNSSGSTEFIFITNNANVGYMVVENNNVNISGTYDQRFITVGSNCTVDKLIIKNNTATGVSVGYQLVNLGTVNNWIQQGNYFERNDGYPLYDESNGTATIPAGQTSVTINHYSNTGQYCYYKMPRTFIAIAEDGTPVHVTLNNSVSATLSVDTAPSSDLKVYWMMRV